MWYSSAADFRQETKGPMYYYKIKYAESPDGVQWDVANVVCLDFEHPSETRLARPCVRKRFGSYEMWYAHAIGHQGYRIGYATSSDGFGWDRRDEEVEFGVGDSGWDSEMTAYPYVFDHGDDTFLLYNGNDYGRTGFGYATINDERE
jgi:hypothetical protein